MTYNEVNLLAYLEEIKGSAAQYRAMHLKFSELKDQGIKSSSIVPLIEEVLVGDPHKLFGLPNQDLLLFLHGSSKGMIDVLQRRIGAYLEIATIAQYIQIYDMGVQWHTLYTLGQEELHKKTKQEATSQAEAKAKQTVIETKPSLTETFLTLVKQRGTRTKLEILIVEDDLFSQKLIVSSLQKEYQLRSASDGKEAINTYLTQAPDIMFLDIELPDLSGHDVLKKILEVDKEAYIIMLSGKKDQENVLAAMKAGAKGFIAKPFTRQKLFEYIHKHPGKE